MRDTSLQAYEEICADGTLRVATQAAARGVAHFTKQGKTVTGHELDVFLDSPDPHKRLSELERRKVVYVKEKRPCTVTGRRARAYALTGNKAAPIVRVPKFKHQMLSPQQRRNAKFDLEFLLDQEEKAGRKVTPELKLLCAWL
jgi:hypothetical protein